MLNVPLLLFCSQTGKIFEGDELVSVNDTIIEDKQYAEVRRENELS